MKNLVYYIALFTTVLLISSCSSYPKVKISGTPGTVISVPNSDKSYTIDASGKTTVELEGYKCYSFLLSRAPGSSVDIPFALNYKENNTVYITKTFGFTFYTLSITGCALAVVGALADASSLAAVGGAVGLCGALAGLACDNIGSGFDVEHKYKYLEQQTTNDDLFVTEQQGGSGKSIYDSILGTGR